MTIYRKKKGTDVWHWCTNCRNWPEDWEDYDEVDTDGRPEEGELDNECRAKEREGDCKKKK